MVGAQTAVWETETDTDASVLRFELHQNFDNVGFNQLLLGRFRLSVTSDDRALFADGLPSSGDVTANWQVLSNPTITGPAGMIFNVLGDDSILAGGTIPVTGTYIVEYAEAFEDITGIRLEALEDSSLPFDGPGLAPYDANFVITELVVTTEPIPEPSTIACMLTLLLISSSGIRMSRRKV